MNKNYQKFRRTVVTETKTNKYNDSDEIFLRKIKM